MTIDSDVALLNRFEDEVNAAVAAAGPHAGVDALAVSWRTLRRELLPLEGVPRRDCPSCGKRGFAAATRCGFCWTELTP